MSGNLTIEPFRVDVDDATLDDLRARLRNTRFPQQLPDAGWDYGTEREYLRELVTYWADAYDWPARQARMNAFDHFRTEIDGTDTEIGGIVGGKLQCLGTILGPPRLVAVDVEQGHHAVATIGIVVDHEHASRP